jgi:hypothetical protein
VILKLLLWPPLQKIPGCDITHQCFDKVTISDYNSLKKRITAHLIQCSLQSKGITDTERRTRRGLGWDKAYVVTDRIFQALAYLHLYEKL